MNTTPTVVDVRTPGEFSGGHVAGSINIPLPEILQRAEEIAAMRAPVILCCASGMRSAQATALLATKGIRCENGGSWLDVNFRMNNN